MKSREYEVEIERHGITPKAFWNYCNKCYEKKTGMTLEAWIDSFEEWASPTSEYDIKSSHEDWDEPLREVAHSHKYSYQIYLQSRYNFILEYDDGYGYMYATEFKR